MKQAKTEESTTTMFGSLKHLEKPVMPLELFLGLSGTCTTDLSNHCTTGAGAGKPESIHAKEPSRRVIPLPPSCVCGSHHGGLEQATSKKAYQLCSCSLPLILSMVEVSRTQNDIGLSVLLPKENL